MPKKSIALHDCKKKCDYFDKIAAYISKNKAAKLASLVFKNSHEGILVTDKDRNIILINEAFTKTTGYSIKDVFGKNPRILKSNKQDRAFYQNLWTSIAKQGYWQGEIWNRRKNGEIYPEWEVIHVVKDEYNKITNFFSIFSDLTDSNIQEDKIKKLQLYDALTGLPNEFSIKEILKTSIDNANDHNNKFAVIAINIDLLAKINSSLGFDIGDKVIKLVAEKMQNFQDKKTFIGRFSSDTFIIIFPEIKNLNQVINFTKNLLDQTHSTYNISKHKLNISTSIGISIYPDSGKNIDNLISNAIEALKEAKNKGRNTFEFSSEQHQTQSKQFLNLENKLTDAVKNEEFFLYYQPQVETTSGKITAVEALIRWQSPSRRFISPAKFIPVAEETGLIIPITKWVLKEACMQNVKWQHQGLPKIVMSVNIPPLYISQKNFVSDVLDILQKSKLDPDFLELEITERGIMSDVDACKKKMDLLKKEGIKLAIDDFGTGYSSLSYLVRLPLDKLKIDVSFVKNIIHNSDSAAIVNNIIGISKNLRLTSIAEGVETKEQFLILRSQRCDSIQGFYFSRPVPPNIIAKLIKKKFKI